jgi:hypothetical protein
MTHQLLLLPQLFCKERALMSCECMRQCHAFYCRAQEKQPWVYDCTNFKAFHGEAWWG